jgi:hypothetical protein
LSTEIIRAVFLVSAVLLTGLLAVLYAVGVILH